MKYKRPFRLALLVGVSTLLMLACLGSGSNGTDTDVSPQDQVSEAQDIDSPPADDPVEQDDEAQISDAESDPAEDDTSADESGPPLPDPNRSLEATDPSIVQLATGHPQLIEFFSFT